MSNQRIVYDIREIPEGYVPVSSYGANADKKKAKPEYKAVRWAIDNELVASAKFCRSVGDKTGPVFIHPDEATKAIELHADKRQRVASIALTHSLPSDAASLNAVLSIAEIRLTMSRIEAILERLTTAVEGIATQPKTPQQELLHTINGNGFHS
jgi:hypothetical protein